MSRISFFAMALGAALMTGPAVAREEIRTGNGQYEGVESSQIEVLDWPQTREMILSSYGLTDIPMISFEDVQPVGDPANPDIFEVDVNNVNMIAIMGQPTPTSLLPKLPGLFPDLTEDDLLRYNGGLVITAITLPDQPAKVDIMLLREATDGAGGQPTPALAGERFEDTFGLVFPDETFQMNNTQAENMQLITVVAPIGVEEVGASLIAQLERDGIDPISRIDSKDGSIGAENDKGTISITLLSVEGEPDSIVQMQIQKKQ